MIVLADTTAINVFIIVAGLVLIVAVFFGIGAGG